MLPSKTPSETQAVRACVMDIVADLRADPTASRRPTMREAAAQAGTLLNLSARRSRAYLDNDVTVTTEAEVAAVQARYAEWGTGYARRLARRIKRASRLAGQPFSAEDALRVLGRAGGSR